MHHPPPWRDLCERLRVTGSSLPDAKVGAGSHGRAHTSFPARLNIDQSSAIPLQGQEVAAADGEVESS